MASIVAIGWGLFGGTRTDFGSHRLLRLNLAIVPLLEFLPSFFLVFGHGPVEIGTNLVDLQRYD